MRKIFEQYNLQQIIDKGREAISKLTDTENDDNLARVKNLHDEIVKLLKKNPQLKLSFPDKKGNNLIATFEGFQKIFYDASNAKLLFDKLDELKRDYQASLSIPDDPIEFVRKYGLKKPASYVKFNGIYKDDDGYKKWKVVAEKDYLKIVGYPKQLYTKLNRDNSDEVNILFVSSDKVYNCYFYEEEGEITGGTFEIIDDGKKYDFNVTKISSTTNTEEVEDDEWKCINQYKKNNGITQLQSSADGTFKFENITQEIDDRKLQVVFYKGTDKKVVVRFKDDSKLVPGMTGKWECGEDGKSYKIIWDSGKVVNKGTSETNTDTDSEKIDNTQTDDTQKKSESPFTKACGTNIKACPTKQEVLDNKKSYSLCMKCPEIKELQENPRFQTFYNIRLRALKQPEKTDEYYGPAMQLAVQDFQASNRLQQTGNIGKYTYERITMPYKPVTFVDDSTKTKQTKADTADKWLRANQEL